MDATPIFTRERNDPAAVIAGWHSRPAATTSCLASALTIDVEDYFQVEAFFDVIRRDSWDSYECRVERNVERILELLSNADARATFFMLAWIGKRYPSVVRTIVAGGHEIASHGSEHRRADAQDRSAFSADVTRAKAVLEDIAGREVKGYRAPSFSVMRNNLWVMEALAEAGYRYSSSTYPIAHDNYGIPEAPRFAFHPLPGDEFLEIPVTSLRLLGRNWPCGGGGYFRLLPYRLSEYALNIVNRREGKPCVFYFHPWEIDPDQPRVAGAPLKSRLRHYTNLDKTEARLARLFQAFRWRRIDEIFLPPIQVRSAA
jgi:polysaccharide deacetylase family protein (PEP-CTERM system associated)